MIKYILIAIFALLVLARVFAPNAMHDEKPFEPMPLPVFALDTVEGGDRFYSSELEEGVSLLTFMSYTCGYCTRQSQYLAKIDFPIPVYLVSINDDLAKVQSWINNNNIEQYYAKFGMIGMNSMSNKLGVSAVPTSFIVKDGIVVHKIKGMIDAQRLPSILKLIQETENTPA